MHQQNKQHDVTAEPDRPGLLASDTSGMNFYRADPVLTDLLRLHLPDALFRHIERLSGEKWFCSNADAEVVMLLARPQGAEAGTRGVGNCSHRHPAPRLQARNYPRCLR